MSFKDYKPARAEIVESAKKAWEAGVRARGADHPNTKAREAKYNMIVSEEEGDTSKPTKPSGASAIMKKVMSKEKPWIPGGP